MKNKKYKIEYSSKVIKQLGTLSDKEFEEVSNGIKEFVEKIQNGKYKPEELGQPIKPVNLKLKLLCGNCGSRNIYWWMDKNSREVYYNCENCGESAWMTEKEYKSLLKKYPKLIFTK